MSTLLFPRHPLNALPESDDGSKLTIRLPLAVVNPTSVVSDAGLEGTAHGPVDAMWSGNFQTLYPSRILDCLTKEEEDQKLSRVSKRPRCQVYIASLGILGTHVGGAGQLVVCKVAHHQESLEWLFKEARLYTSSLLELQEQIIPGFLGLFAGYIDGVPIGVAVLRYCGHPLSETGEPFMAFSQNIRSQIYVAFTLIHEVGVLHNDIAEQNVLCDHNGKIWIIDFGRSQPHPDRCRLLDIEASFLQNTVPRSDLALCSEMHNLVEKLQAWYTPEYYGIRFSDFNNIPTIDQLTAAAVAKRVERNAASAEAISLLNDFRCWLRHRWQLEQEAPKLEAKFKNDKYVRDAEIDALRGGVVTL